MNHPAHAERILSTLADRLEQQDECTLDTPFGVRLWLADGAFPAGHHVLAPGLDECSPLERAQVLACGTREDHAGVWCLVRYAGLSGGMGLIEQAALQDCRPTAHCTNSAGGGVPQARVAARV